MDEANDWAEFVTSFDAHAEARKWLRDILGQTEHRIGAIVDNLVELKPTVVVVYNKKVTLASNLCARAREVYNHILSQCPTDASILAIKRMIDEGPSQSGRKISGRTIDALVTRCDKFFNVHYYLDVTDPANAKIVDVCSCPGRKIELFDVCASYRTNMAQFSKTYFDCFGRGDEVTHQLTSGEQVGICLCQFMFFIWADRFRVFDFLELHYEQVINVRKYSQKTTYRPKRPANRKALPAPISNVSKSVLCSLADHAPKNPTAYENVIVRPRKRKVPLRTQ